MAISGNMIWEIRSTGNSANGGGFRNSPLHSAPSAPTVNGSSSGGTVAANTYYIVITYSGTDGESAISAQSSVTTTGATSSITVTSPAAPGLGGTEVWNVYVGTVSGGPYFPQGTGLTLGSNRTITTTPPTSGTQPPGADYSQQTSPQVTIDNSTITATTAGAASNVVTISGATPAGAWVGNVFNATGGTNINTGRYEITAVSGSTFTVTGASNLTTGGGAGSAITGRIGGAVDHPATISGIVATGQIMFVKNGTFQFTNNNNVSGGKVSITFGGTAYIQGYDTTRRLDNTDANKPVFNANATGFTLITFNNGPHYLKNVSFSNTGANASVVFASMGTGSWAERIDCNGATQNALTSNGNNVKFYYCTSTNSTISSGSIFSDGGFVGVEYHRCFAGSVSSGNPVGFSFSGTGSGAFECAADGVGNGFLTAAGKNNTISHCHARNTTNSHGFTLSNDSYVEWSTAWNCGTSGTVYGFFLTGSQSPNAARLVNCAGGNNRTANYSPSLGVYQIQNFVALSTDPCANAGAGDYNLNNTAGGGASIRGVSYALPGTTTTVYRDEGAGQVQSSSSTITYFAY